MTEDRKDTNMTEHTEDEYGYCSACGMVHLKDGDSTDPDFLYDPARFNDDFGA